MKCIQNAFHAGNINESFVETRRSIYYNKNNKPSMTLPSDPSSTNHRIFKPIPVATTRFTANKKQFQLYFFMIMSRFLIATFMLL